ncbi:hypothetical protein [Candidatus Phycosocius spiralis]|uniref:DUF4345 domain-containing protein n=1 Tax=Candidatus Phycosocius spiralis TaxID=2815099 RepID=A0ABQ4PUZ2_9PROT|nr:hypothetical protein [Candidatus Phycosocius spiralis]GIU66842.1 hypothetical protein PsB1_0996 [Candidatus Phycosocius spiralis]
MYDASYYVSTITLVLGVGLGIKGMFDPMWAAQLVRLQPANDQAEGFGEFRSTFGGMFLGLHLGALTFLVFWGGMAGVAACSILAAGWLFTALGRTISYCFDTHTKHVHVLRSIAIEIGAGLAIAAWPISYSLKNAPF